MRIKPNTSPMNDDGKEKRAKGQPQRQERPFVAAAEVIQRTLIRLVEDLGDDVGTLDHLYLRGDVLHGDGIQRGFHQHHVLKNVALLAGDKL
jgi:hypothetical protein